MFLLFILIFLFFVFSYLASQEGYDEHLKKQELTAMTSRYLILENSKDVPVAYVHYRFVIENGYPVLYW